MRDRALDRPGGAIEAHDPIRYLQPDGFRLVSAEDVEHLGTLTLGDGASLIINRNDGFTPHNAIESATNIIMGANSWFSLRTQDANTLKAITLVGSGTEIRGQDDWHVTGVVLFLSGNVL